jgi:hypothetical protein
VKFFTILHRDQAFSPYIGQSTPAEGPARLGASAGVGGGDSRRGCGAESAASPSVVVRLGVASPYPPCLSWPLAVGAFHETLKSSRFDANLHETRPLQSTVGAPIKELVFGDAKPKPLVVCALTSFRSFSCSSLWLLRLATTLRDRLAMPTTRRGTRRYRGHYSHCSGRAYTCHVHYDKRELWRS